MTEQVDAIKIRCTLHIFSRRTMNGFKTLCGRTASVARPINRVRLEEIDCPKCANKKTNEDS